MKKCLVIVSYRHSTYSTGISVSEFQVFHHSFTNWCYAFPDRREFSNFEDCINYILALAKQNNFAIDYVPEFGAKWYDIYFSDGISLQHYSCR